MGKKKRNKNNRRETPAAAVVHAVKEPSAPRLALKFHLTAFILLVAVGIGVYANSFHNEFIWDDVVIIPPNEYVRHFNLARIFSTDVHHFSYQPSNFYRPLQMLSYAVNYKLGALEPLGYHLINTLAHAFNAVWVYLIILLLNEKLSLTDNKKWFWVALSVALIWLVHPIHTQNTTYISGRADVFVAFFMLATLYAHARFKNIFIAPLFFTGALLSKESAVIAPFLFVLYDVVIVKKRPDLRRYGAYFLLLAVYAALRLTVFNFPTAFTTEEIPELFPRLLTSARAVFCLLGVLAVPVNLSMLRNIPWETSLLSITALASVLGIIALCAGAFLLKKREPLISFCLGWSFITYLPVANIMPMNANMSEHWMYLPSIGIILAVIYGIWKYCLRQTTVALLAMSLILTGIYGSVLVQRNKDFKDQIVFFEKLLEQFPTHARSHYNLGTAYGLKGEYEKAKYHFEECIKHNPKFAPGYANLGLIHARNNDIDKAIELYEKANTLADNLVENYANLGIAYARKGESAKAIEAFEKTLKLNPKHPAALNGLGIEHAKKKQWERAEEYFRKVLALYPGHPDATNNLNRLQTLRK